ncbi:MAG: YihY/virulence factor BrkB family protein [Bacilli bacterium]|nr:YihY/virulence factor BrkB family protein [Bacilli bacterium]
MKNELKKLKEQIKRYVKNFFEILMRREMRILPGQLAFFLGLSIIPTFSLVAYVGSLLNLDINSINDFFTNVFNENFAGIIIPTITSNPGLKFIIYLVVGYFVASNGTASIIVTSNTIYGIKNRNYFYRKVKAILMEIILITLVLFILIIPVFGSKIIVLIGYLNISAKIINRISFTINFLKGPISWFIMFILIKILYVIAPDRKMYGTTTTYGAIFSTVGFIIVTGLYSLYVNHIANYNAFYGGAANIIILLLWLYLISYVFVIGMALNQRKETLDLEITTKMKPLEEIRKEEELEKTANIKTNKNKQNK